MKNVTFELSDDDSTDIFEQIRRSRLFEPIIPVSLMDNASFIDQRLEIAEDVGYDDWMQEYEQLALPLTLFGKKLTSNNIPVFKGRKTTLSKPKNLEIVKKNRRSSAEAVDVIDQTRHNPLEPEDSSNYSSPGALKVTIKDKPTVNSNENLKIMKWALDSLLSHAADSRRLREIRQKIRQKMAHRLLQRVFNTWRLTVRKIKAEKAKKKTSCEIESASKIESFVQAVMVEQQKNPQSAQKKSRPSNPPQNITRQVRKTFIYVNEPLKNRLDFQKKIIAEQRQKLVEQNRIIEEMKLKQLEEESRISGMQSIEAARRVLTRCRQKSPSWRQIIGETSRNEVGPRKFVMRMEARAEARAERARKLEAERQWKLEEKRQQEEAQKRQELESAKRQRLEQQRQARLQREEEEKRRVAAAERRKIATEAAENFHRRFLLRRRILGPLISLVKLRQDQLALATRHCEQKTLRKALVTWKNETQRVQNVNLDLAASVYRRNLLWSILQRWILTTKHGIKKLQVACDYCDLRVLEKYFEIWRKYSIMLRLEAVDNAKRAAEHWRQFLMKKYFHKLRKYVEISDIVRESDKCREQWRQLVKSVVPDFAPQFRGVLIDD